MSAGGSTEGTSISSDDQIVSLDIDELCKVIDSEVKSVSPSPVTTPKAKKDAETLKSIKMESSASPASSEPEKGARKRPSKVENKPGILKKPKIEASSAEDGTNKKIDMDDKKVIQEPQMDIFDEDPKGLYGLSPEFLKSKGIKTPLTNWVHLSNIPCDKSVLREVMELAGTVLVCHVVHTKVGYAKVKYSHPIEAAQAVSMLNKQTLVGKTLTVSIDPGPHKEIFLPMGLKTLGPGFSDSGKPLKDILLHFQRHLKGKPNSLSNALFGGEIEEVKNTEEVVKAVDAKKPEDAKQSDDVIFVDAVKSSKSTPNVSATKIKKDKISQTDNDGSKAILDTVYELKKNGVSTDEIVTALKALKKPVSRRSLSKTDFEAREIPSRSSYKSKSPLPRQSRRSVSPRRPRPTNSTLGPRSGSSGNFRQQSPGSYKNFNNNSGPGPNAGPFNNGPGPNAGPFNNGPGPNASLFNNGPGPNAGPFNNGPGPNAGPFNNGPGPNAGPFNNGPGPNAGPFNNGPGPNAGPFGPNTMPNNGPNPQWSNGGQFMQPSGPGPSNPGQFGPNIPGNFGGNSGPSGPFSGNTGPSGPNAGPFVGNSGPMAMPGPNQQFGGNAGPIGPPRQNQGPSDQSNRSSSNVVVLNNLPPSVTYQLLTEKMNQCGVVQFLNVTKPGTALVRYTHDWEAARCINTFDKTVVDGRQIEARFS